MLRWEEAVSEKKHKLYTIIRLVNAAMITLGGIAMIWAGYTIYTFKEVTRLSIITLLFGCFLTAVATTAFCMEGSLRRLCTHATIILIFLFVLSTVTLLLVCGPASLSRILLYGKDASLTQTISTFLLSWKMEIGGYLVAVVVAIVSLI